MGKNYASKSIEDLNKLLPSNSNWKIISNDGVQIFDKKSQLVVTAQCKCGNLCKKAWARLQNNRFFSCGCIIERNTVVDLENEIWLPCVGYEGIYEVSNLGRVKRVNKVKRSINGGIVTFKERLCTEHIDQKGYSFCILTDMAVKVSSKRIHKLVTNAFMPNPNKTLEVNHIDGNKQNNKLSNFEWVTHQENMTHAKENNLLVRGEDGHHNKLKETEVLEIRQKYVKDVYTMDTLAKEYNVSRSGIQSIIERRTWTHI